MREPGEMPKFQRLISDLQRAQTEWELGNHEKAEKMLKAIASVAYAEVGERGEHDPRPE